MITDAYGVRKKHDVMTDTWGHLFPVPGSKYPGYVLVVNMPDGDQSMCARDFGINGSPMEFQLACSILDVYEWSSMEPGVWRVDCTAWFYKTCNEMFLGAQIGKLIHCKPRLLFSMKEYAE